MRRASSLILILAGVANSSIPRSSCECSGSASTTHATNAPDSHRPAWNASPKINEQGYLCDVFRRIPGEWEEVSSAGTSQKSQSQNTNFNLNTPMIIRQVPGDGCCLFHAVAVSLNLIQYGRHLRMDSAESLRELKAMSRSLRQIAVDCLRSCGVDDECYKERKSRLISTRKGRASTDNIINTKKQHQKRLKKKFPRLFIQGTESMKTSDLLFTAASQYGITSEEYCDLMEQDSYWGGGPEIVALCNVLKRPINVYELVPYGKVMDKDRDDTRATSQYTIRVPDYLINKQFCLRRMATFGSPKYNSKMPLHILSADSRFPDLPPEWIFENGNHFMALFPVDMMSRWAISSSSSSSSSLSSSLSSMANENGRVLQDSDRKQILRGGDASAMMSSEECMDEHFNWLCNNREWYNDLSYSDTPLDENKEVNSRARCWYQRISGKDDEARDNSI